MSYSNIRLRQSVHLAFSRRRYYNEREVTSLKEATVTRLQKIWVLLFTLSVTCSMLLSSVAFAINDPK
jgi:hypothetical protein